MNLLADESVEQQIVDRLRLDGHSVLYVAEMEPSIGDLVPLLSAETGQIDPQCCPAWHHNELDRRNVATAA